MLYALGDDLVDDRGACYVADNAIVIGKVVLERDSTVWFNAVIRGDNDRILVGEGANIQDGAVLHTDTGFVLEVGRGVSVGCGVGVIDWQVHRLPTTSAVQAGENT